MPRRFFYMLLLCVLPLIMHAQNDTLRGLQQDIYLHPADGFTAYTLHKGEFVFNQSPFTLPLPSWAWYGLSNKITMEIDLLPLIGGLFIPPHLPIPSINFRFKLTDQHGHVPAIAFETMYHHLWQDVYQSNYPNPVVRRRGNSWYNHLNFSFSVNNRLHFHFSTGLTYSENLYFHSSDSTLKIEKFYPRILSPDFNISIDYRPRPWLSMHATASYGTTFVYLDNVPHKREIAYGFRLAPFYKNRHGFLRHFRMELIGLYIFLPDINEAIQAILPIYPYFYWQWQLCKK